MADDKKVNYWLFQSNPNIFQLKEALRAGLFFSFPVKQHKNKIKLGDKVILWQKGRSSGVFALCTVASPVEVEGQIHLEEAIFYIGPPTTFTRVELKVEYNLWNKPITKDLIPNSTTFDKFYAGMPGMNYKATKKQYQEIIDLIEQYDLLNEPVVEYVVSKSAQLPLNLVLSGPPGTGKTYHSINYALAIIENRSLEEIYLEDRDHLRRRFEEYEQEGMIHFVTFHQSTTYEDFVEGIKPRSDKGQIKYVVENGIFKQISLEAKRHLVESLMQYMPQEEFKTDFNKLYKGFTNYLKSKEFNSFTTKKGSKILLHKIVSYGNISLRSDKSYATYTLSKSFLRKLFKTFPVAEVIQDVDKDIRAVIGAVDTQAYWAVFAELKKYEQTFLQQMADAKDALEVNDEAVQGFDLNAIAHVAQLSARKHVLIIDEINRGNIAAIFGELITLIEPDKREGMMEAMSCILPYSKTWFTVPPNLHIIATMNTANRSVEAMDMALRRRFTFVEMLPQPNIIKEQGVAPNAAGVDLERMLATINQRIRFLLNKDYAIGHAYFMNISTLDDLREVFATKIIPLLEEYFYGDYTKIGLILGKDFIEQEKAFSDKVFADFDFEHAHELAEKEVYHIRKIEDLKEGAFIRIYDSDYKE